MRYRRIAACDRRQRVRRARSWVRSQIEGHAMGGDPIERRIAPSAECGYQYGGARGGGGFSPRSAAETITATLQDGLEVTVAELAGVLAEDLTGRATDVAQWAEGLLDDECPKKVRVATSSALTPSAPKISLRRCRRRRRALTHGLLRTERPAGPEPAGGCVRWDAQRPRHVYGRPTRWSRPWSASAGARWSSDASILTRRPDEKPEVDDARKLARWRRAHSAGARTPKDLASAERAGTSSGRGQQRGRNARS